MSTERPAPRPGTGVRPQIRSSVNARSGREPKEQRPDRGAGRGQTGPAASGYAVFVAPRLSRVPDGGSEGRAPTIRSARAVPGPAPQGVASQRPRAPGRQSPTSCASAARAAFDFAAQSPPTLSIRRYRGWPPQASSSQQGAHPHPRADPLGACDRRAVHPKRVIDDPAEKADRNPAARRSRAHCRRRERPVWHREDVPGHHKWAQLARIGRAVRPGERHLQPYGIDHERTMTQA